MQIVALSGNFMVIYDRKGENGYLNLLMWQWSYWVMTFLHDCRYRYIYYVSFMKLKHIFIFRAWVVSKYMLIFIGRPCCAPVLLISEESTTISCLLIKSTTMSTWLMAIRFWIKWKNITIATQKSLHISDMQWFI